MRTFTIMALLALVASCSSSTQTPSDARDLKPVGDGPQVADLAVRDVGPKGDTKVPADLGPDKPKKPARWELIAGATLKLERHTSTLLNDGRVLIAGGRDGVGAKKEASLFVPSTSTMQATAPLSAARYGHTATLLKDGRVLVAGGSLATSTPLKSTEIYDPTKGTWSAGPDLPSERTSHQALLLASGDVFVAGGLDNGGQLDSMAVYQAATNSWKQYATSMTSKRVGMAMVLLKNNKVLIVGGYSGTSYLDSLEIFDPATALTTAITQKMSDKRNFPTATLLPSGKVLIVGGEFCTSSTGCVNTTKDDIYDPTVDKIAGISHVGTPPSGHAANALSDGSVLITGGVGQSDLTKVVIYDPTGAGSWAGAPSMQSGRYRHSATGLTDGSVLVVGGIVADWTYVEPVERFYP